MDNVGTGVGLPPCAAPPNAVGISGRAGAGGCLGRRVGPGPGTPMDRVLSPPYFRQVLGAGGPAGGRVERGSSPRAGPAPGADAVTSTFVSLSRRFFAVEIDEERSEALPSDAEWLRAVIAWRMT